MPQDESVKLFDELESIMHGISGSKYSRKSMIFGDEGSTYTIKIIDKKVELWLPCLISVREKLEALMINSYQDNTKFNVCVVQRYPSGKIEIKPHRDKEMPYGTKICGISLGQTRMLSIAKWKTDPIVSLPLENGSLYIMLPPMNNYYSHAISKDDSKNVRISLTFRNYQS